MRPLIALRAGKAQPATTVRTTEPPLQAPARAAVQVPSPAARVAPEARVVPEAPLASGARAMQAARPEPAPRVAAAVAPASEPARSIPQAAPQPAREPEKPRMDPAPSRAAYRMQRVMLTPSYRLTIRVVLPFLLALTITAIYLSDEERRDNLLLSFHDIRNQIETRPEFMVRLMAVEGASAETEADIREVAQVDFPISTFDLDLDAMRETIIGLPAVAEAKAIIRQQGVLEITVTEREPAVLWRDRDGIHVLDRTGIEIGELENRAMRPDLQVLAGYGAPDKVAEALRLLNIAAAFGERLRGLERIANRRWDVVLTPDLRIMLPEEQPELALERAIALHEAQDVLSRDIAALDLRLAARPTIRMNANALERWRQIKDVYVGTGNR